LGRTIPVVYGESFIDGAINTLFEEEYYHDMNAESEKQESALSAVRTLVPTLGAGFKDESFRGEKEHRLVAIPKEELSQVINQKSCCNPVKYRCYSGWIKPYLELNCPSLPIKSIALGPSITPDKEEREDIKRSIRWLLKEYSNNLSYEPSEITIDVSDSPFRG